MIERTEYMDMLKKWRDEKIIKVVTGLRRCGKSTLLYMFEQFLLEDGVDESQIISVNLEALQAYALESGSFSAMRTLYTRYGSFLSPEDKQVLARVIRGARPRSEWESWI